jgi:hypothetical protein
VQRVARELGEGFPGIDTLPDVCGGEATSVRTWIPMGLFEQVGRNVLRGARTDRGVARAQPSPGIWAGGFNIPSGSYGTTIREQWLDTRLTTPSATGTSATQLTASCQPRMLAQSASQSYGTAPSHHDCGRTHHR